MDKTIKNREKLLQALVEKMVKVIRGMHTGFCCSFGKSTLSRPQAILLFFIAKKRGGVSAKELAQYLNVTSGAITQFIDTLAGKKLVIRKEDRKDRRIQRIMLTKSAKEKLMAFKKKYYAHMSSAFNILSEKELMELLKILEKINITAQ